jgi:hypothetical protein
MPMTERDFCFWLQGWREMEDPKSISPQKWKMICDHLDLVFQHVAGGAGAPAMEPPIPPEKCPPVSSEKPVDAEKRSVLKDHRVEQKELMDQIKRMQVPYGLGNPKLIC